MFEEFQAQYPRDTETRDSGDLAIVPDLPGLTEFVALFGGASFGNGIYRVLAATDFEAWSSRVALAFPEFADRATCFAFDWLGRAFALDKARDEFGEYGVLMLEPGTGEILRIPANLQTFHETGLLEFGEAALAINFYEGWRSTGGAIPRLDQCIGYRKPLFLGGLDEVENLELSDLDVYWHLSGQIIRQTRGLPPGTPVSINLK